MLNLYGLKYFYDACRLESMTEAAEVNFISRSAVSQAIKRLEQDLGVSLLKHKRREFIPTTQGTLLYKNCKDIFAQIDNAQSLIKASQGLYQGQLRVGSARTLATFIFPGIVRSFKKKYENVEIKVFIETSENLVKLMDKKSIDIALYLGDEAPAGTKEIVVHKGFFHLVAPVGAKNVRFAVTGPRTEVKKARHLYQREFSEPLPEFAEMPSWDVIFKWVNLGICGGLVPDFLFENKKGVRVVLEKVWPYEVKVVFPAGREKDLLINAFLESMRK